ncbi:hypothetical protein FPHOBKDP_00197 [Listeria phage LPJP1]|nr:hypothetical protein FPHOBKDP_00197 [Listeria phage LPJP1]
MIIMQILILALLTLMLITMISMGISTIFISEKVNELIKRDTEEI